MASRRSTPSCAAWRPLGVARRGYFVEGMGGAQFALAGAVERLRAQRENRDSARPQLSGARGDRSGTAIRGRPAVARSETCAADAPAVPAAGAGRERGAGGCTAGALPGARGPGAEGVGQPASQPDARIEQALTALAEHARAGGCRRGSRSSGWMASRCWARAGRRRSSGPVSASGRAGSSSPVARRRDAGSSWPRSLTWAGRDAPQFGGAARGGQPLAPRPAACAAPRHASHSTPRHAEHAAPRPPRRARTLASLGRARRFAVPWRPHQNARRVPSRYKPSKASIRTDWQSGQSVAFQDRWETSDGSRNF